jgi:hypothetical protein
MVHKQSMLAEHFFLMGLLLLVILSFVTEKHGPTRLKTTKGIEFKDFLVHIHGLRLFLGGG